MDFLKGVKESDNKALILHKAKDLRVGVWPIDKQLAPNDCLLESKSVGICGTDLHLWKNGFAGDFVVDKPLVLGHEPSAQVIAVGSGVKNLKSGDKVAVEPIIACGYCEYCRKGRYNLCPISFEQCRGLPPMSGCLRKYYTHPSKCCFKVGENMSFDEASMVQPMAVVVHAIRRINLQVGHKVLVCGAGPVGIMALLAAKAFGATKVCITDINKSRLEMANRVGADKTFLISTKEFNDKEFAEKLVKEFGFSPDRTLECTGVETSLSMAVYATKMGGKIALIGLGPEKVNIPLNSVTLKEIDLIGSCRIKDDYPLVIDLISSGKVDLKPLVTHRFKIDAAIDAFELLKSNKEGVVKVMIHF